MPNFKKTKKDTGFLAIILVICIVIQLSVSRMRIRKIEVTQTAIRKLENSVTLLDKELEDVVHKAVSVKKYIVIWEQMLSDIQKGAGSMNLKNIENVLRKIATKHLLSNLHINFSKPEMISSIYKKTVDVWGMKIDIEFDCLSEYAVQKFLQDLDEADLAFHFIHELTIKRIKNFDKVQAKQLINGNLTAFFNAKITLYWYEIFNKR
jgi:hypothetical protein